MLFSHLCLIFPSQLYVWYLFLWDSLAIPHTYALKSSSSAHSQLPFSNIHSLLPTFQYPLQNAHSPIPTLSPCIRVYYTNVIRNHLFSFTPVCIIYLDPAIWILFVKLAHSIHTMPYLAVPSPIPSLIPLHVGVQTVQYYCYMKWN